jgi:hypothetical protein
MVTERYNQSGKARGTGNEALGIGCVSHTFLQAAGVELVAVVFAEELAIEKKDTNLIQNQTDIFLTCPQFLRRAYHHRSCADTTLKGIVGKKIVHLLNGIVSVWAEFMGVFRNGYSSHGVRNRAVLAQ